MCLYERMKTAFVDYIIFVLCFLAYRTLHAVIEINVIGPRMSIIKTFA